MHLVSRTENSTSTRNSSRTEPLWAAHRRMAQFNRFRLNPQIPNKNWREELEIDRRHLVLEHEILEIERSMIQDQAKTAPSDPKDFMVWFENLKTTGPGQNSPLFKWLAETARYEDMKWFIQQEVAGEAGFEDLTALTQVKVPTQAKLEMARNYWDEMGRGREAGMHGPMLSRVADEFGLQESNLEEIIPESLALGNILLGMAMNRRFAFHSIGALGVVELTAPARAQCVYEGLKRLGISSEGQRYYLLHASLDVKHSADWNREVLTPLLEDRPEVAPALAEGALMRLNAGARCFERYQQHLWS